MPRTKIGSRRILFGRESMSFRELADKSNTHTFNKWRRFANFTSPVLARCSSRVLLEFAFVNFSQLSSFAALWPVSGQDVSSLFSFSRQSHTRPDCKMDAEGRGFAFRAGRRGLQQISKSAGERFPAIACDQGCRQRRCGMDFPEDGSWELVCL